MCGVCKTDGACFCEEPGADDPAEAIREARELVAEGRQLVGRLEERLAALLAAAGRRPGDGSDQLRLFEPEAQSRLFDPEPRPA